MTFDTDDVHVLKAVFQQLLAIQEFQVAFVRLFLGKFDLLDAKKRLHDIFDGQGDSESEMLLRSRISEIEQKNSASSFRESEVIKTALARMESDHEKMEALLEKLNAMFPDSPSTGNPPSIGC